MKITLRAVAVLTCLCSAACWTGCMFSCQPILILIVQYHHPHCGYVNNSQMVQMEQLTKQVFEKDHANIKVNFVTLPENDLRSKVTQDVATNAGKFDIATIGSYETPIWAHNGWLQDLSPYFDKMSAQDKSSYNYEDLLKPIMASLSYQKHPYSVPFYGESSMMMYNKQIFAQHHLTMPDHPTWDQIIHFAQSSTIPHMGSLVLFCVAGRVGHEYGSPGYHH